MLLAIDTATRYMSIALHSGDELIGEQSWHAGNRHTQQVAPAVQSQMAACNVEIDDLTAVAVSVGPGSYTGLRIGVAFAKGLAQAKELPLIGMTTLDMLAASQPYAGKEVTLVTIVQAGRGNVITRSYDWLDDRWQGREDPLLLKWSALVDSLTGPVMLSGEINAQGREMIEQASNDVRTLNIAPVPYRMRRAGFLADYAWQQLRDATDLGTSFSAHQLAPIYIHSESNAGQTTKEA